jgi:hypothetical protein
MTSKNCHYWTVFSYPDEYLEINAYMFGKKIQILKTNDDKDMSLKIYDNDKIKYAEDLNDLKRLQRGRILKDLKNILEIEKEQKDEFLEFLREFVALGEVRLEEALKKFKEMYTPQKVREEKTLYFKGEEIGGTKLR